VSLQAKDSVQRMKDKQNFSRILDDCYNVILRRCLSILRNRDDAEDAVQETLLRAEEVKERYRSSEYPCAWFVQIARNLCLDELRRRKRGMTQEDASIDDEWRFTAQIAPPPDDTSIRVLAVEACLKRLTPREEEVVRLFLLEDLTWDEVAKALGATVGSVRNDYERARRRLKQFLEASGFPPSD
jgi:RNA polymerase sigma-70 factor, ECF subfamily